MEYREAYWDSPPLKAEFIRFLEQIHNLDLTPWEQLGYWDPLYRPFSYFDGDTLAASVCLYSMDMVVAGKPARVAQISGVGTHPDYRRQGLSRQLTQKAIDWATPNHDFFYLFADDAAVPLYESFGFRRVTEHKSRIAVTGDAPIPGAERLDLNVPAHRDLVFQFASSRTPVSNQLGVRNPRLFMFWCICVLVDHVYHIPALNLLLLYERRNGKVTVHDIVGRELPPFADIYPCIRAESDTIVEFSFMTDRLELSNPEHVPTTACDTFVMGDFPLAASPFLFPLTAQA